MDKTKLEEKVNESFTLRKLSDHFEVSQSTIRYWLNKYHLKTKNKPYNNCGRYTFKGCTKCGENVLCFVVIALVVEFFALSAKFYNFGRSLNLVSFNQ